MEAFGDNLAVAGQRGPVIGNHWTIIGNNWISLGIIGNQPNNPTSHRNLFGTIDQSLNNHSKLMSINVNQETSWNILDLEECHRDSMNAINNELMFMGQCLSALSNSWKSWRHYWSGNHLATDSQSIKFIETSCETIEHCKTIIEDHRNLIKRHRTTVQHSEYSL